jgi:hypothetical protein
LYPGISPALRLVHRSLGEGGSNNPAGEMADAPRCRAEKSSTIVAREASSKETGG